MSGTVAYRRLLRAARRLFAGDSEALVAGRDKLRSEFFANREASGEALAKLLSDVNDLEDFLRNNVVQGRLNERGNYEVKLKAPQQQQEGRRAADE